MNERTQWAIKYALKLRRGAAYRIPLAHPQWKLRHANPCYFRKVGEKGHLHFGIFRCIFPLKRFMRMIGKDTHKESL